MLLNVLLNTGNQNYLWDGGQIAEPVTKQRRYEKKKKIFYKCFGGISSKSPPLKLCQMLELLTEDLYC